MKKFVYVAIFLSLIYIPLFIHAQSFTYIEPLPNTPSSPRGAQGFVDYLQNLFRLAIGAAAILAVIRIVMGGVQYTTSYGSEGSKSAAKEKIWNAILGLLLVLLAWLGLWTINPDLVNFRLSIPGIGLAPLSGGGGGPATPPRDSAWTTEEWLEEKAIRDQLEQGGIDVVSTQTGGDSCSGPLADGVRDGCTNVYGLPGEAVSGVVTLEEKCKEQNIFCEVTLTAGTEGGHQEHRVGQPVVDIDDNNEALNDYIRDGDPVTGNECPSSVFSECYQVENGIYKKEDNHWHVIYE